MFSVLVESSLLEGMVVFVSPDSEYNSTRIQFENILAKHSALVVRNINRRVSHAVCHVDDTGTTIDLAQEHGVKLISPEFFEKSIKSAQVIDEEAYLLDDDDIVEARKLKENMVKRKRPEVDLDRKMADEEEAEKAIKKAKIHKDENEGKKLVSILKKGSVPVDPACKTLLKIAHVYEENGAWSYVLNQTSIDNNNNKFYNSQLLEADNKSHYWCWFRWGRVGNKGQSKAEPCDSLESAKDVFKKKFFLKTGNKWKNRSKFKHISGKYTILDIDYGDDSSDEAPKKMDKSDSDDNVTKSKLPTQVQKLLELVYDTKKMQTSMIEMNYDFKKMPLGKLKQVTIDRASTILTKIETVLNKSPHKKSKLIDLSNQFYTLVPHYFGMKVPPVIDSIKMVKKKFDMLEELGFIQIANKVIKESNTNEHPLDVKYKALNSTITPIDPSSPIYHQIQKYVRNSHAPTHDKYSLKVVDIFLVDRDGTHEAFMEFEDLSNHLLLWHGSRITNFVGILSNGLKIAPPEAPVTGYMFGKGIYFADMVSKSANYCHATSTNPQGCLLLCQVALGNPYELKEANNTLSKPPKSYHSTKGLGATAPDPLKAKPEYDNEKCIIPLGKYKDTGVTDSELLYNEYVVYNVAQCRMRYIVNFEFLFK